MNEFFTIQSFFLKAAETHKDKILFHYPRGGWKSITYGEFRENVLSLAAYLINEGIGKADRVSIISENRPEWCISYMAAIMAGAAAVPINAESSEEEVINIIDDSGAKAVFYSSKTGDKIRNIKNIKRINFDSSPFKEALLTPHLNKYPDAGTKDIASLIYTSGTTGAPKGVMLSHKNLCSDAEAVAGAGLITETDNIFALLPLHHTYPFMCTFLAPLFMGVTVTFAPGLKGPEMLGAIREKEVTALIGIPQLLELIRDGIIRKIRERPLSALLLFLVRLSGAIRRVFNVNAGRILFPSLHRSFGGGFRYFTSGGARLDPSVMKDLEAMGFTVIEGYGLTETSPVVTFNPISKRKPGSVGRPLEGADIKIMNPDERGEGEIAIKGPMVMEGYYKNPGATEDVMKEGFFLSGDLGYIDKDGYLFITGRAKEVIVLSSGKNIYPEDVERQYLKIPFIKEICVVGHEQKGRVDSIHAVIVPDMEYARKNKIGNIMEGIRWELKKVELPPYMRIKGFSLKSEPLPKTPLGKLRRFMIKELPPAEAQPKAEDRALMEDSVGKAVAGCITPLLAEKMHIHSTDSLELDLGLDSLKKIELVVSLEEAFSIELPEAFASEALTVGELVGKIKEYKAQSPKAEAGRGMAPLFEAEATEEEKRRIGLKRGKAEWFIVVLILLIVRAVFKIFFRMAVSGTENIPEPPFIIAPNHASNMDGFVIGAGVPLRVFKELYFQGYQKYFTGPVASVFGRASHVIPIDRETHLERAFQVSAYALKNKKALCIFPEGGRSEDGELMPFRRGIGILAVELNLPVVPAWIEGTFEALPRGAYIPKFKKINLAFGKPLYPGDMDFEKALKAADRYQYFADALRDRVLEIKKKIKE
jgi:long-chain acyl-CoA synthetase